MTTIRKILLFLTRVIEAWNSVFGSQPARETQEKQKTEAETDNRQAYQEAARKAGRERERKLRDMQREEEWK